MGRGEVRNLCAGMQASEEGFPFGDEVAVFKVGGKMFALVLLTGDTGRVTVKCDPEWAVQLRARYQAIEPGYHANKRHWNTVTLDGSVPPDEVEEMILHSYELVLDGLPRKERERITGSG
jgi:predicted DNA-binding protein (MmcQ/YjbR family)